MIRLISRAYKGEESIKLEVFHGSPL